MKNLFLYYFFIFSILLSSQITIKVIDYEDLRPIKEVFIYDETGVLIGKTDSLGIFHIDNKTKTINKILLTKDTYRNHNQVIETENLIIPLFTYSIKKYKKDANAIKILKKMWANRTVNNINQLNSYSFRSYTKISVDGYGDSLNFIKTPKNKLDSINNQLKSALQENMLFLAERGTFHKYNKNYGMKNIIEVSKTSGLKDPVFYELLANRLFINEYPNSINPKNLIYYNIKIIDSLLLNNRKTYAIYISSTTNNGIKKIEDVRLYIDSETFALVKLIGQIEKFENLYYEIEWKHFKNIWYTKRENVKVFITDEGLASKLLKLTPPSLQNIARIRGWATISTNFFNLKTLENFTKKDFLGYENEISPNMSKNIEPKLEKYRPDLLLDREFKTYEALDSLSLKYNFNKKAKILHTLTYGFLKTSFIDWDIFNTISYNNYESFRFQVGMFTNSELSRKINFEGYLAKAVGDKDFKGGLWLNTRLKSNLTSGLITGIDYDVVPTGREKLTYLNPREILESKATNIYNNTYHTLKKINFDYYHDFFKNMSFTFGIDIGKQRAEFDYLYKNNPQNTWFSLTQTYIKIKYAPNNKYMKTSDGKITIKNKFPHYYLTISKNWNILNNGNSTQRFYLSVLHKFSSIFGDTEIIMNAGAAIGETPIMNLFEGMGSAKDGRSLWGRYSFKGFQNFETMAPGTFFSDRFFSIFFMHKFKRIKISPKKSLRMTLVYNGLLGELSHKSYHKGFEFNVPNKYYQEVGIEFNKLVLGILGIGAYYRIGTYTNGAFDKNLYIKTMINL